MKKLWVIFSVLFFTTGTYAQSDIDALRLSRYVVNGSARTVGVGGGFGALGGDFTAIGVNPAGLATFRSNQFMFTPGISLNASSSDFDGQETSARTTKFFLPNIGVVFASTNNNKKWKTSNFAIGTNRLASFNQRFRFDGRSVGSITERWVEYANGVTPDNLYPFEEGMAYDALLLFNPDPNNNTVYSSDVVDLLDQGFSPNVRKVQNVTATGNMTEFSLSYAANYDHKLSIGVSIGMPLIRYNLEKRYEEVDDSNDEIEYFNSLVFTENVTTTGIGINAKLGIIYRLSQEIRLGAAVHTPNFMALSDNFANALETSFEFNGNTEIYNEESPDGDFQYGLRSPLKIIASGAYILGKLGLVTGEVEFVDYGAMTFDYRTDINPGDFESQEAVNASIENKYGQSVNLRVGGEFRMDIFRVRAGYGFYGSPFQKGVSDVGGVVSRLSGGIGIHNKAFFLDLAMVKTLSKESYIPYTTLSSPNVINIENKYNNNQFVMTLGFKF